MRLVVLCGMPAEQRVLEAALPGVLVLSGTAKSDLPTLVPADTTHIAGAGLFGGLLPRIRVPDVCLARYLVDGGGNRWTPDLQWSTSIMNALHRLSVLRTGDIGGPLDMQQPGWAARALLCPWYSSGVMDQGDTAAQRATLLARTGAWAIDDESRDLAAFATARGLRFVIMRACSDDASETLPLAMRGPIMNADGSSNIQYFLSEAFNESPAQTALIPKIVADYNASLTSLQAAAPLLLQSLI